MNAIQRVRSFLHGFRRTIEPEPTQETIPETEPATETTDSPDSPLWEWTGGMRYRERNGYSAKYQATGCQSIPNSTLEALVACDTLFGDEWFTGHDFARRIHNYPDEMKESPATSRLSDLDQAGYMEVIRGKRPYEYRVIVEPEEVRYIGTPGRD